MDQADGDAPDPVERTLVITRRFAAPRELVFRAWTDPALAMRWMGPRDHPVSSIVGDARPGGQWRASLRPANGDAELWQGGTYLEVIAPERLVFTFAWDDDAGQPGLETIVTVTFAEHDGGTTMTFRQSTFASQGSCDGHERGWSSTFARLAEFLDVVE